MAKREKSFTKESATKTVYAAFEILKQAGGSLPGRELLRSIENAVNLSTEEKARYEKTGYVKWESIFHFYTIDCVKAGYLLKIKGVWYLTPEGEKAMTLGADGLLEAANIAYKKWKASNDSAVSIELQEEDVMQHEQEASLEQLEGTALESLKTYIHSKNPYEFQQLVAALLRAMGYYISFEAGRGKDGGIDIIAYQDPLGIKTPRIVVQVKHKPDSAVPAEDIRQLQAVAVRKNDASMFVTSGWFSPTAWQEARSGHIHMELIGFESFIDHWKNFYSQMSDPDKRLLPPRPIYFLDVN